MNQVFLIIAHNNPKQLSLLINQLHSTESHIYIHIDKKSNILDFKDCVKNHESVVFIKKRYNLKWGASGIIHATLELINEVIRSKVNYSHMHVVSGQDILIKPISELVDFFSKRQDFDFIEHFKFPSESWKDGGYPRVYRYHIQYDRRRAGKFKLRVYRFIELLINDVVVPVCPLFKKRLPRSMHLYGGSSWWSLKKSTAEWLYSLCLSDKNILRFFKSSFVPDETMFHTILLNSHLKDTIINDAKRAIDWSRPIKGGPGWLDINDYQTLVHSDAFFARKVQFPKGRELYTLFPVASAGVS